MEINKNLKLTNEYIRGLVGGEGCFTFSVNSDKKTHRKRKVPAFILQMNIRDTELIEAVPDHLGLKNKIYIYPPYRGDGIKRGPSARLIVREFTNLKDIIIPFFYKKLKGYKAKQFMEWLEWMGSDPLISDRFKSLYRLYKWGMYDTYPKFTERFKE
ncbi:LAGLIDADG family homing endonuclease [Candidatus Wolfebacteria bacterium]|nr:LAGLIDADG family homing endonuclease [Candidatus Wolfebacteria bacterium]